MDMIPENNLLSIGLQDALKESIQNYTYTPLLKQELKTKIQYNRLKRGEKELKVDFEPKPTYKLREEEVERQRRRREVNRIAAFKFRQKKRSQEQELEEKLKHLQDENRRIQEELTKWRRIHQHRQQMVDSPEVSQDLAVFWEVFQQHGAHDGTSEG